ncbi:hypothetical protein CDD83_2041 [Cordyceps sp. RAO-2017]|nr:hypothetical protein CDD83_2041 [Cordyceps sp. RAO-2017]
MADAFRPPQQSSLDRRQRKNLNAIIEEAGDDRRGQPVAGRHDASHLRIEAWLSPVSDHFPTPRGVHYLAAPILPSSPSTVSGAGTSPTNSSNPWNRTSLATDNTEFEDLYDVCEGGDAEPVACRLRRSTSVRRTQLRTVQDSSSPKQPARLTIPGARHAVNESSSAVNEVRKSASPMPPTPSVQLHMSPAQVEFMGKQQALEVPTISAPPSLDGSLDSEQLAALSAPVTPVIGNDEVPTEEAWAGVLLQPGALATLQALASGECDVDEQPARLLEIPQASLHSAPEMRQQPSRVVTRFPSDTPLATAFSPNPCRQSLTDLTRLEIPSPSDFFSELSPRTRSTWHLAKSPEALPPPTSTTAEQFYRCPWNAEASGQPKAKRPDSAEQFYKGFGLSSEPIEHIVEMRADAISDELLTARPIHQSSALSPSAAGPKLPSSPQLQDAPTEIVTVYDPDYARKQQKEALSNLDRTELWLSAQRAYLQGISVGEDAAARALAEGPSGEDEVEVLPAEAEHEPTRRTKTVRFSEVSLSADEPKRLPPKLLRQESAYYRAFQDYIVRAHQRDVFVHQLARFEALQAQRAALRETHRKQLLGKYQLSVVPQSAKKRLSANVARGDDELMDNPEKLRREKEFEAANQMAMPTWHVAAVKFLNGGRLITAPVTKRLARPSYAVLEEDGAGRGRARVLDLGGQSTCDWAWHCALQYPNAKVYTVTTKAIRQLSNANIRGPPNHRQVAVERLTRLPFADDQFDLVSARELHSILKFFGENGEDEWEGCLRECMRVLKPGGYLEFSVLDSDIMNAGPLGLAKSVEFGFSLKTLGYDPSPSKMWLGRLARAGFEDVRRVWMCLPMGPKRGMAAASVSSADNAHGQKGAPVMGSSDNIASVCSIVGGWSWERWLLRCEMEKVAGELRLADTVTTGTAVREAGKCLDGVHAVMEEGRNCRSGFRMLNGYARKPRRSDGEVITIGLAN